MNEKSDAECFQGRLSQIPVLQPKMMLQIYDTLPYRMLSDYLS